MGAQYLVRFDDICPEMNWQVWQRIEQILIKNDVTPILAVVPDNQDPTLKVDAPNAQFWEHVRQWQAKGWCIGLHGHQHRYETTDAGIIGLNNRSEFAGLPYEVQLAKIDQGVEILQREQIRVDAWIAPGHSFDKQTIAALLAKGIHVISDGYFSRPVRHMDSIWIPQQLWRLQPMHFGTWTICYHHNHWSADQLQQFERDIALFRHQIVSVDRVLSSEIPQITFLDRAMASTWSSKIRLAEHIKKCMHGSSLIARVCRHIVTKLRP